MSDSFWPANEIAWMSAQGIYSCWLIAFNQAAQECVQTFILKPPCPAALYCLVFLDRANGRVWAITASTKGFNLVVFHAIAVVTTSSFS